MIWITMYIQCPPSVPVQAVVCTVSSDSDFDAPFNIYINMNLYYPVSKP